MPNLKSAKKSLRKSRVAQARNKSSRTSMRNAIRAVRQAANKETAMQLLNQTSSIIDKTIKKKIIHKNTGARYKANLAKLVQQMD